MLEHVLDDLGGLAEGAGRRIGRAASKSGRFVGEMREIAAAQGAAGLTPALFEAVAEVYAEIARTPLGRVAPEDSQSDLGEALRSLRGEARPASAEP